MEPRKGMTRREFEITDMNEITTYGFWTVNTSVNAPANSTTEWALSVRTNKKGDKIQIASPYTGSATKTYTRVRRSEINNSWTSWV